MERGSLLNKRYRIVEVLGQGGMAAVYRAIDENLGVEVAVKENLFTTEEYARQFRLEATILASMRQPNLPRVSDHFVIEQQGQYLVMDYIEGEDLRQRMDRLGPLPEQEVIIIGVAISDAMSYMHSRKPMILHRDIKPGNVRITPTGHIYLVDFGLAKVVQGREATNTGARAMTPGYSPPEQYGTARTDPRSDIYSLGATLYSALTDMLPEDGLARAMDQAVLTPISKHNPRVSAHITEVLEKCLAIRPDDRFQTADELKVALLEARSTSRRRSPIELVLQPPPVTLEGRLPGADESLEGVENEQAESARESSDSGSENPPGGRVEIPLEGVKKPKYRNRNGAWVFLAFLALLFFGGFATYRINPEWAKQAMALVIPAANSVNTPTEVNSISTRTPVIQGTITVQTFLPVISPSLTPTVSATPTRTPNPTRTSTPIPSPTPIGGGIGQIAFASDRSGATEIWVMNVDGSGLYKITDIREGACQPRWSPDGLRLVFISPCVRDFNSYPGASLFIMNADGSDLLPLPSAPGGDYDPSWSPDGNQIAFTSLRNGGISGIFILNLADNTILSLVEDETQAISQPSWSPDGKMIAYINSDNRLWVMDVDGTHRRRLTIGGGDFVTNEPAWSPDGSVVVFTRMGLSDPTSSTWLMAVPYSSEGALPVEVPNSELVADVSYSYDGYWFLFKSWLTGNHDIFLMRVNGVDRHPIVSDPAYDFDPVWRPQIVTPP
jgi:eukaryotic-like serine/threonine-protein kinase